MWIPTESTSSLRGLETQTIRPLMDVALPGSTPSSTPSSSQVSGSSSRLKELNERLQLRSRESPARVELPSTGTLDREEMSELSDISTENVATTRSPNENTMMVGLTEKPATSSSFSEIVKNTLGNFFPFTMGTGTGDEAETQEEEEDDDGQDAFGSQVSFNSSTQENDAHTERNTGTMDQFGVVRTIRKTTNGSG